MRRDRSDPAEMRERSFGGDPCGVVAGGDQQQRSGVNTESRQAQQARRGGLEQLGELIVEAGTVGVDVEHPTPEGVHRQLRGERHCVAGGVRAQPGSGPGEHVDADTAEAFPQVIRPTRSRDDGAG